MRFIVSTRRTTTGGGDSRRRERGAVLIHVAIALVGLLAFAVLTIDYGVMWVSRRQAQNAADAGALSGAISLAWTAPGNFDAARASAETTGEANAIFGATPDIQRGSGNSGDVTQDISFPTCPPGAPGLPDTCVRVNVYRNQQRGPALPVFFAPLLGITEQGVRATATAQVASGTTVDNCLFPAAVPDKWLDDVSPDPDPECMSHPAWQIDHWCHTDSFDNYDQWGNPVNPGPEVTGDLYEWTFPRDLGRKLTVIVGDPGPQNSIRPEWAFPLSLDRPGANDAADLMRQCRQLPDDKQVVVGGTVTLQPSGANFPGQTRRAIEDLVASDSGIDWCPTCPEGQNLGCPSRNGINCAYDSERVRALPVFSYDQYQDIKSGRTDQLIVQKIIGIFVMGVGPNLPGGGNPVPVYGYTVPVPESKGVGNDPSSFLRRVILVR